MRYDDCEEQARQRSRRLKWLLIGFAVVSAAFLGMGPPIAQDEGYHHFADERAFLGIPNAWNVLTNLGFLCAGAYGLALLWRGQLHLLVSMKRAYSVLFVALLCVCVGSGYYHWAPNSWRLSLDRLPMTVGFMALTAIVLAEFLSESWARKLFVPMVAFGVASIGYWFWGLQYGTGDLRWYIFVQFFSLLLIALLLLLGQNRFDLASGYAHVLLWYVLAKLAEHFDFAIYALTRQLISGHALKHVLAAWGLLLLIRSYHLRRLRSLP